MSARVRTRRDEVVAKSSRWRSFAPYYAYLGLELESLENGECVIRLPKRAKLCNSKGGLHGGAIASLLDIAMSQAVRSGYEQTVSVATISMTINYLVAAHGGVKAHARILLVGTTIAFTEGKVMSGDGIILSCASAAYRIIRHSAR